MKHESSTQANRHVLTKPKPTPHFEWTVTFWWFDGNHFPKPKTVTNVKHHDESYSHVLKSLRPLETSPLSHLMLYKLILSRFTFLWYEKLWWVSYQSKGTSATQKSSYKVHSQATILVKTVFQNNWHNLQNEQLSLRIMIFPPFTAPPLPPGSSCGFWPILLQKPSSGASSSDSFTASYSSSFFYWGLDRCWPS